MQDHQEVFKDGLLACRLGGLIVLVDLDHGQISCLCLGRLHVSQRELLKARFYGPGFSKPRVAEQVVEVFGVVL